MRSFAQIVLGLLGSLSLYAAAPLTHLVIAENYLGHCCFDRKEFLLGNVFPDIRYLGNVARGDTHEYGVKIKDIEQSTSAFRAGMRLHSFVDEVREELVVQWNMYEGLEEIGGPHVATLLKFIEDEILYDEVSAPYFIPFFNEILKDEIEFGVPAEATQKWHFFIMNYLSKRPSESLLELARKEQPFFNVPAATIKLWSEQFPSLVCQEKYREYVENLLEHFSKLFEDQRI